MKDALIQLSKGVLKGPATDLVPVLFGERQLTVSKKGTVTFTPFNKNLDHSQVRCMDSGFIFANIFIFLFTVFLLFSSILLTQSDDDIMVKNYVLFAL